MEHTNIVHTVRQFRRKSKLTTYLVYGIIGMVVVAALWHMATEPARRQALIRECRDPQTYNQDKCIY